MLELSIVITIFAFIVAGVAATATQQSRTTKQTGLKQKMDAVETALTDYIKANNRIPCPADGAILASASTFGMETGGAGTCTPGTGGYTDGVNTVGGVVPTRALGLPDDAMFDPWGGRFTYIVDKRATATNAFLTYSALSGTLGTLTVYDYDPVTNATNARTSGSTKAIAALISHGPNGHGAYQSANSRKSSGSLNNNELVNCHCTTALAANAASATSIVQAGPGFYNAHSGDQSYYYDDTVRYYLRSNFLAGADMVTERPASGSNSSTGNNVFGVGGAVSR